MKRKTALIPAFLALLCCGPAAFAGELDLPAPLDIGGWKFSHDTIVMAAVVAVLIYAVCWLWSRTLSKENPGRGQVILEFIVKAFDTLVKQSIGPNRGRKYLPFIGTLFIFIWSCNMIGLIPIPHFHLGGEQFNDYNRNGDYDPGEFNPEYDTNKNGIHDPGFRFPACEEPTKNLNVPLGLAFLFVILIGHGSEIYYHGIFGYIKSYFSPGGGIGLAMFPLNVVGKCAELISVSFRLFGNIFGGSVILIVVTGLLHYMLMPVGLYFYFGMFAGTVQAFVFTMLALTYISSGCAEEEH